MAVRQVIEGVHVLRMGMANTFLTKSADGLKPIDAGYPSKDPAIFGASRRLARTLPSSSANSRSR